jgi:hypothetical protein
LHAAGATEAAPTAAGGDASSAVDAGLRVEGGAEPAELEPSAPLTPLTTKEGLLQLITRPPAAEREATRREALLLRAVGPDGPGTMNQGNPAIARHSISRERCLAGLREVVIQSPAARRICRGHENMVPIYEGGAAEDAKACIDVFEFPNRPCELPFVWASAEQGREVCKALGKRLCTQQEWVAACSADPAGGARSKFAYGNELDLGACNTSKRAVDHQRVPCNPTTIHTTWKTCGTNTEPAGAFPRCRSRLGVFDLHGNVAEAMSRFDPVERKTYSQLKGSAFFYVDVARREGEPHKRETYPDHCAHDPRWHVQPIARAWHVNYHLGFRCCLSLGAD